MKKLFASLFVTAFVLLASACGGGGVYNTVGTQKLTTSQSSYTMSVGQTEMVVVYGVYDTRALQATAEPSAICSVAGKTENVFHVSGHSAGKCTVTITTEAYQTLKVGRGGIQGGSSTAYGDKLEAGSSGWPEHDLVDLRRQQ